MEFDKDIISNTKLNLSLGDSDAQSPDQNSPQFAYNVKNITPSLKSDENLASDLRLSLSPNLANQASPENHHVYGDDHETDHQNMPPKASFDVGVASSFLNSAVKRERDGSCEELVGVVEKIRVLSPKEVDDQDEEGGSRKKLRLTKEQSVILEDRFKVHTNLNPIQKQELAQRLNLRPRQVEVWFQNRRARIKLKQTEADHELLKKSCEKLTDENRRLRNELQELKVQKLAPSPLYMQLPAATLIALCPSCEKLSGGAASGTGDNPSRISFSIGKRPDHIYNPFTKPSAAC